jgi:outer membrane protein TolC
MLYVVTETPTGVGGPASPLVTSAAGSRASTSVATNLTGAGLGEAQVNLSMLGTVALSNGSAVPNYQTSFISDLNWKHSTTLQNGLSSTGLPSLVTNTSTGNFGLVRGFSSGATVNLSFNNLHQNLNSLRTSYSPYSSSTLGLTFTQPLMRGYGRKVNERFLRIARNEQRIGDLLFQQQLTATVTGVVRLYTDLVSLYEDEKVKQQALTAARKLESDTKAQVEEGTLAPIELTRAAAQVAASRHDLANAQGLLEEQEAILKNVLSRGDPGAALRVARIIPLDRLEIPERDPVRPLPDLMADAGSRRPDLAQAELQIANSEITLEGARNAVRPQVDLVAVAQNGAMAGTVNPFNGAADSTYIGGFGTVLEQLAARKYPSYGAGIQVTLPFRNRVAEADLARDELQVRQTRIRTGQLRNQARLEVEDALIAMRRARVSWEAAKEARRLQEESLAAEQVKFEAGASTSFFVIQYQTQLSQAQSTEIAARGSYFKARAALGRATGSILTDYGVVARATP